MVAITGALLVLMAVKAGMLPVPEPANPIEGWLLLQLKVTDPPVAVLLSATASVGAPLQITWLRFGVNITFGKGFTVMVNVSGRLSQVMPPLV